MDTTAVYNLTSVAPEAAAAAADRYPPTQAALRVFGNVPLIVAGSVFNVLNVGVFAQPRMRQTSRVNWFLLTLAVCDQTLLVANWFMLPLPVLVEWWTHGESLASERFVNVATRWAFPVGHLAHTAVVYVTLMLSIYRYLGMCHPLWAQTRMTGRRVLTSIVGCLLFSWAFTLPRWFEIGTAGDASALYQTAFGGSQGYILGYKVILYTLVIFVVPFAALAVTNICIFNAIKESQQIRYKMARAETITKRGSPPSIQAKPAQRRDSASTLIRRPPLKRRGEVKSAISAHQLTPTGKTSPSDAVDMDQQDGIMRLQRKSACDSTSPAPTAPLHKDEQAGLEQCKLTMCTMSPVHVTHKEPDDGALRRHVTLPKTTSSVHITNNNQYDDTLRRQPTSTPGATFTPADVAIALRRKSSTRQRHQTQQQLATERGVTRMLLAVTSLFVACNTLPFVNNCLEIALRLHVDVDARVFTAMVEAGNIVITLNSAANFFVYAAFNANFRRRVLTLLCGLLPSRPPSQIIGANSNCTTTVNATTRTNRPLTANYPNGRTRAPVTRSLMHTPKNSKELTALTSDA